MEIQREKEKEKGGTYFRRIIVNRKRRGGYPLDGRVRRLGLAPSPLS